MGPPSVLTLHWHPKTPRAPKSTNPGWHRPLAGSPTPKWKPRYVFHRVKKDSVDSVDQESSTVEEDEETYWKTIPGSGLIDSLIEKQRRNLQRAREFDAEFKETLRAAELSGSIPKAFIAILQWLQNLSSATVESESASLAKLEIERDELKSSWKNVDALSASQKSPLTGSQSRASAEVDVLEEKEEQAILATGLVIFSFVFPFAFSYIASLFGIDLSVLIKDGEVPSTEALLTWAAWSAPYIGGTAIAGALAPRWIGNRGTIRLLKDNDTFQSQLPLITLASVSIASGYSQVIVHQGVFYLCLLNLLAGGNSSIGDPVYAEDALMQQSLGSLVAAPTLWKLFSKPAAIVLNSALEAGWWLVSNLYTSIDDYDPSQPPVAKDDESSRMYGMMTPMWRSNQDLEQPMVWLTGGRIFASSLWLGTETVVTGNLWYPICTGGVGIFVGMLARRSAVLNEKKLSF